MKSNKQKLNLMINKNVSWSYWKRGLWYYVTLTVPLGKLFVKSRSHSIYVLYIKSSLDPDFISECLTAWVASDSFAAFQSGPEVTSCWRWADEQQTGSTQTPVTHCGCDRTQFNMQLVNGANESLLQTNGRLRSCLCAMWFPTHVLSWYTSAEFVVDHQYRGSLRG